MKQGIKIFKRLAREKISDDHFRRIENITGDLILTEYYDENQKEDIQINISQILNMDLENSTRYVVFQYGQSHLKNEKSHFAEWKKQEFANRKCDISLIIVDHVDEKIFIVCAEVKKTLRLDSYYEARQQLISSYVDLNILSSLITYNIYELNRIFFTVSEEISIPKQKLPSSMRLLKDKNRKNIPCELIWNEFKTNKFYYVLDSNEEMLRVNKDLSKLNAWASDSIFFQEV